MGEERSIDRRENGARDSADRWSERTFGATAFAAFDPGAPAHRAAAAAFADRLIAIGFGPRTAAALFGLTEIADVRASRTVYYDAFVLPHDKAGLAARFFVLHLPAPERDVREMLGDEIFAFLAEMAAIMPAAGGWQSIAGVTWFANRLIVADARAYNAIWPDAEPFADLVMPPGGDSVGLERIAPRTRRASTLDLCCGAGAQALAAATYSERVTGVDINPRALRFARFNAAANRIESATFVMGDVYEPLPPGRFDAILANPPFVPWPDDGNALLYRGGGPWGDEVVARVLAGANERLAPGGFLAIVADYANVATLPARMREWQGDALRTLLLLQHHFPLLAYAETHVAHLPDGPVREAQLVRLMRHFATTGIETLDFGYLLQDGAPGTAHVVHSGAALTSALHDDVAAWFAHQRRLTTASHDNPTLVLAPGLRLSLEVVRAAAGTMITTPHALPGPASLVDARHHSQAAFVLLDRVAAGDMHLRDVTEAAEMRELAILLTEGWVRYAE